MKEDKDIYCTCRAN